MRNTSKLAIIALCNFMLLAGCEEPPPPKTPPPQPLVVGTSGPAPIATEAPVAMGPATEEASGDAPRIMLGSLTTPGRVFVAKDRVVVVHFFATWCEPCKQTFPKLQALYAKDHERGLEVIGVSVDDEEAGVGDFARRFAVKFPIGWDAGHALTQLWKVDTMPATYIVNREGNIAHTHKSWHDGDEAQIAKEVEALL